MSAWQISERERPFAIYFRAAAELIAIAEQKMGKMIQDEADQRLGKLQRYRDLIGESAAELTIRRIEEDLDDMIARQGRRRVSSKVRHPSLSHLCER